MEKQHRTLRSFHDSYGPRCNRRAIGRDTDARAFIGAATKAASPQLATGLAISNKRPVPSEMKLENATGIVQGEERVVAGCLWLVHTPVLGGGGNWGFFPN
jgi:hypothetical protein